MTTDDKYKNLERVNFWITNCDTKVSYLLALQGIVLTIIFATNFTTSILETISYRFSFVDFGWKSFFRFLEGVCLYSFLALIFLSLFNAYLTLRARLNPKVFKEPGLITNSVLFFETIADRKFRDFITSQQLTTNVNSNTLDNDIDSQVFINSKICQLKFKHYNLTLKYSSIGFILGIVYLLLSTKNGI